MLQISAMLNKIIIPMRKALSGGSEVRIRKHPGTNIPDPVRLQPPWLCCVSEPTPYCAELCAPVCTLQPFATCVH